MARLVFILGFVLGVLLRPAFAQGPLGILSVTVVDQTAAVIPGATVTLTGTEDATRDTAVAPAQTSPQGVATFDRLTPGRYSLRAEFPGFQTREMAEVRVRAGENRQAVLLAVELRDQITVERDRQEAASDRATSFGTTLTREQIEALSDDPDVLRQQLQDMAGPGAVISVDSFEGAALPPKAQIRSIRIARDQFAAENHFGGGLLVEIITQPGLGPLRANTNLRIRSGALSGRNAFTGGKAPEQMQTYGIGLSGSLIPQKMSFNLNLNGVSQFDTPNINVALGTRLRSEALGIRTPRDNVNINANVDYALTLDQTLRFGFTSFRNDSRNLGIGAFDEEERAFSTESMTSTIRGQHIGPLGRRMFTRTRVSFSWSDSESTSAVEQPTIRVTDAFVRGGAQVAGGQHSRVMTFGSDLDYVRGIHTFRTGLQLDGGSYRSDDRSNYLGTFVFESLEAFNEGRPRNYTRRIGDPNIRYHNLQAGIYAQDDVRVRRNLTLSAGVRLEAQTHVGDLKNIAPRVGVTWAPAPGGATTLRASWGIFYDWLQTSTYEQTLRVDGFRQQELNIVDPSFPDIAGTGIVPAINRYVLADGLRMPTTRRFSAGIDQRLARTLQVSATFNRNTGTAIMRGLNLNAPINGVRPDPLFGNIVQVVSDGESTQQQLALNMSLNPTAQLPNANAPRINWKRITTFFNYTVGHNRNNSEGAFSAPATGSLDLEWGPTNNDVRHRFNANINTQVVRNLQIQFGVNATSGTPYTIRTGRDDNGDSIFNDRPAGVGRGTLRTAPQLTLNSLTTYTWTFGTRGGAPLPPGIAVIAGGGAPVVQTVQGDSSRYRLQLGMQVLNLLNRANYGGYSGTLTSPFFGQPTMVTQTRKIDFGVNLSF